MATPISLLNIRPSKLPMPTSCRRAHLGHVNTAERDHVSFPILLPGPSTHFHFHFLRLSHKHAGCSDKSHVMYIRVRLLSRVYRESSERQTAIWLSCLCCARRWFRIALVTRFCVIPGHCASFRFTEGTTQLLRSRFLVTTAVFATSDMSSWIFAIVALFRLPTQFTKRFIIKGPRYTFKFYLQHSLWLSL